ncbi:protein kinase [bacterium]|nr:protein kinase [bacterium]
MSTDDSSIAEPMPEKIGPYRLSQELGAGGMGAVYLGRHETTGEQAALKMLPPSFARQEGFRLRFAREIEVMQQLHSPHIVRFFDHGEDHGTLYYAMEYVPGENLADRLRRERRLDWREAVDITRQLCLALKSAHDAGVIHRDLKPSNILIAPQGVVKLTDFGIAQLFAADKLTVTGGVVGTAEYMSPEQARGLKATKRSDLYSLGAVLYVMLTGRPPFTGPAAVDIMHKHRFGQFDLPSRYVPEIPAALDDLVQQLLEKDPDKRLPDAYVLLKRLEELIRRMDRPLNEQVTAAAEVVEPEIAAHGGHATLMRDLVRAEVRKSAEPSAFSRFTDNIWVLLLLLAGLIGGVYWISTLQPSGEVLFARGEELMQKNDPDWQRARDEFFEPLIKRDPATWKDRVQPWLDQIAVLELDEQLSSPRRRRLKNADEETLIEAQLRLARTLWERGDLLAVQAWLDAIQLLWADDPAAKTALAVATRWQDELQSTAAASPDASEFIRAMEERIKAMAETNPEEAAKLHAALRTLFAGSQMP